MARRNRLKVRHEWSGKRSLLRPLFFWVELNGSDRRPLGRRFFVGVWVWDTPMVRRGGSPSGLVVVTLSCGSGVSGCFCGPFFAGVDEAFVFEAVLSVVEFAVAAVCFEQLFVCALFDDAALFDDEDLVG